jgi:hypothetical protein
MVGVAIATTADVLQGMFSGITDEALPCITHKTLSKCCISLYRWNGILEYNYFLRLIQLKVHSMMWEMKGINRVIMGYMWSDDVTSVYEAWGDNRVSLPYPILSHLV